MFSYDPSNRILKVQKLAEEEVDLGLLEYQKESYQKYLTETIYSDMEYLLQVMRELQGCCDGAGSASAQCTRGRYRQLCGH